LRDGLIAEHEEKKKLKTLPQRAQRATEKKREKQKIKTKT
jgi:hypothetical protein